MQLMADAAVAVLPVGLANARRIASKPSATHPVMLVIVATYAAMGEDSGPGVG